MVEFIQGLRSFTAPTKAFLDYLAEQRFRHGGNPVLAWMAQNLFIQMDKNENMMPTKAKSTGRIDGIVATIMAMGLMNTPAAPDIGQMLNRAILKRAGLA